MWQRNMTCRTQNGNLLRSLPHAPPPPPSSAPPATAETRLKHSCRISSTLLHSHNFLPQRWNLSRDGRADQKHSRGRYLCWRPLKFTTGFITHANTYRGTYSSKQTHTRTNARTHAHTHTHTHGSTHTYTHTHARTRSHTHTHARARTHIHTHTQMSTNTLTYKQTGAICETRVGVCLGVVAALWVTNRSSGALANKPPLKGQPSTEDNQQRSAGKQTTAERSAVYRRQPAAERWQTSHRWKVSRLPKTTSSRLPISKQLFSFTPGPFRLHLKYRNSPNNSNRIFASQALCSVPH